MLIAIQPDDYTAPCATSPDAWSPRWAKLLAERGHNVRLVDIFRADILDQLNGCDGLMWRHAHVPAHREVARRLLPALECAGVCVFPNHSTAWHYDDKVAQTYLLKCAGIPMPDTWVFWDLEDALAFCSRAHYPLVTKLWGGAASRNVKLLSSEQEATAWVRMMFNGGVFPDDFFEGSGVIQTKRRIRSAVNFLLLGVRPLPPVWDLHRNYVLLQEFLPNNAFDTRITIVGNQAFGFRRMNRPGDFRASGSGRIDWNPREIDLGFVRLAFRAAKALGCETCAVDGMYRRGQHVLGEISYTFVSTAVHSCPGHWELCGDTESGRLTWSEGHVWPQDLIVDGYLARVSRAHPGDAAALPEGVRSPARIVTDPGKHG